MDVHTSQQFFPRRDVLRWAALGVGALGLPNVLVPRASGAPGALETQVSMAMHIHASFSEGRGSMEAHLAQAARVGADVIWWTDHDFRMTAHSYRTGVRFDSARETENGSAWTWAAGDFGSPASAQHSFVPDPHSPDESGNSLRILTAARPSTTWAGRRLTGNAWNSTYSTSYGDTTLELDVLPVTLGPDAELVITIDSSYRPASHGRLAGPYSLEYRLGQRVGRWTESSGRVGVVGVATGVASQWQRVTLDLAADHTAIWPDLVPGDASLWRLKIGVRARNGARAEAHVDRLRFHRARRTPEMLAAMRQSMNDAYSARFPAVQGYLAAEVSLVNHLNVFGGDGTLPTYPAAQRTKNSSAAAELAMVDFLKSTGGTVTLNHPLEGVSGPAQLADRIVRFRGFGAHAIEVSCPKNGVAPLADVFDIAARNAIFLTATGVTDDHGGQNWLGGGAHRWLTSAWAASTSVSDLCAAVQAGRVWFNDPLRWNGQLDLVAAGVARMGGVLFTDQAQVDVDVTALDLPSSSTVRVVVGRCDRPGLADLTPARTTGTWPASSFVGGHRALTVNPGADGAYVRAEVRDGSGTLIGFSNPVWVLDDGLAQSVPVPSSRRYQG